MENDPKNLAAFDPQAAQLNRSGVFTSGRIFVLMSQVERGKATPMCSYSTLSVANEVLKQVKRDRPDIQWWVTSVFLTNKVEIQL